MELKLINEQGPGDGHGRCLRDACSAATTTKRWCTRSSWPTRPTARQGTRAQKTRAQVKHSTKKPWRQKGTGRARAGMTSSPLWRGGGRIFPNSPDENFTQKVNKKMYRAGMASILSQLAREERLAVVDGLTVDATEDQGARAEAARPWAWITVLIITDQPDENLLLVLAQPAQRAGARGAPRRPGVPAAVQEGARDQGGGRSISRRCWHEPGRRLMKVLVAPVDLGEGHARRREAQAGGVRGASGRDQAGDQGRRRAAVQGQKVEVGAVNVVNVRARRSASGASSAAARPRKKAYVASWAGAGHQLRPEGGRRDMALVKVKTHLGRPPRRGQGRATPTCTREPPRPAAGEAVEARRAQQRRAHHDAPPGRRAQAALPHRRFPAHTRTASRPRSSASSTTRTAAPTSRCVCYADGERRYIIAPAGHRSGPADP